MTRISLKPMTAIVVGGAAITLAGIVGQTEAHETTPLPESGLRCAVVTHDLGGSVEISGKVTADRKITGAYAMKIRQSNAAGQAVIDQSGDFTALPGRTVTLGQAVLGGAAQSYTAELDLTVDGRRLRCRPADHDTDI